MRVVVGALGVIMALSACGIRDEPLVADQADLTSSTTASSTLTTDAEPTSAAQPEPGQASDSIGFDWSGLVVAIDGSVHFVELDMVGQAETVDLGDFSDDVPGSCSAGLAVTADGLIISRTPNEASQAESLLLPWGGGAQDAQPVDERVPATESDPPAGLVLTYDDDPDDDLQRPVELTLSGGGAETSWTLGSTEGMLATLVGHNGRFVALWVGPREPACHPGSIVVVDLVSGTMVGCVSSTGSGRITGPVVEVDSPRLPDTGDLATCPSLI